MYKYCITMFLALFLATALCADCVEEFTRSGDELLRFQRQADHRYFVEVDGVFIALEKAELDPAREYLVQAIPRRSEEQEYLQYYNYQRLNEYLQSMMTSFVQNGYRVDVIGQSVENRNLHVLHPDSLAPDKKTIIMFGRHHGDEGTANWIIEGFLNSIFLQRDARWFDEYQLILYPMVNPDGTERRIRYNANGRDLNRVWDTASDEVGFIRRHLEERIPTVQDDIIIALDMHGSFVEDFIYRVPRSFKGTNFYELQSQFINELAVLDRWQAGNFQLSSGDPGMSRIFLINKYQYNALTHETIRDIPKNNPQGRSIETLKAQGEAIYKVLLGW